MKEETIVLARRRAEAAVADMRDGPLKIAAFQTILGALLHDQLPTKGREQSRQRAESRPPATGTTGRILGLAEEGFFAAQRSLGEIQQALAERGFHYAQELLGTPLTRLVRKRLLRRTQATSGGKKRWKYSLY